MSSQNCSWRRWRHWLRFCMAAALQWFCSGRARAEDHVDYRYSFYKEEDDRIEVNTHSFLFEKKIIEGLAAKGELIYDGISGATPTGVVRPSNSLLRMATLTDIRRAGSLGFDGVWGPQTFSPQVSYSRESDYESLGVSLNDAIEFNQKNTTLRLGVAHNFDKVLDTGGVWQRKDATDFLIGISQLLSPQTIVTADFTYGISGGYLTDPYKRIRFDGVLPSIINANEIRPDRRNREVLLLTLTQFVKPLDASAELSYRFHHDTFGIFSHTAGVTWHQNLGKHLVIAPTFRYYEQSPANFYYTSLPGFPGDPGLPEHYSADYRLSHMQSFTYGLQVTARITDWFQIDAGYQRYEMLGLDGQTSPLYYPKANIFNIGLRIWF